MDKKAIISWQPKREEANGVFTTRVNKDKKGAINYKGQLADGRTYDYWAFPVKVVKGRIVWIDKLQTNFGFKFIVTLQGANGNLNCIETQFSTGNVKDVCNSLLGIHNATGKDWEWLRSEYSFAYWVFKKQKNGVPELKNGVQQYRGNVAIEGAKGFYNKENPLPDKLKWVQQMSGSGKMEWNSVEEIKFWEQFILGIQKALISRELAIPILPPFYTSLLCGAVTNPTGVEQEADFVSVAQAKWEAVRNEYKFAFEKERNETSSDDFTIYDDGDTEIFTEGANVAAPIVTNTVAQSLNENTPVVNIEDLNDIDQLPF